MATNVTYDDDNIMVLPQRESNDSMKQKHVTMNHNLKRNPLFVACGAPVLSELDDADMWRNYKRVLIVCMRDDFDKEIDYTCFYGEHIAEEDVEKAKNFVLVPFSRKILYGKGRNYSVSIRSSKTDLEIFNSSNVTLENEEIVIPMFELAHETVKKMELLYENNMGVSNIKSLYSLNSAYNNTCSSVGE